MGERIRNGVKRDSHVIATTVHKLGANDDDPGPCPGLPGRLRFVGISRLLELIARKLGETPSLGDRAFLKEWDLPLVP
jgi:hypothetical protein